MKVLFVSSSPLEYSASSNMRNIALLKGLIENGHEIYTLTPRAQEDARLYDKTICNIKIKKKYYIEMSAIRSKITIKKGKRNKLKVLAYKFFSKFKMYDFRSSLANKKMIINEKFDLIISSSDPKSSHLIAENLIKNNPDITKKWIQYWGDPFASDINKKNWLPKFLIKKEEKRLIALCDKVIYVSPFTLKNQMTIYPKYTKKMIFLPIPYFERIIYPEIKKTKKTVGYYGDYRKKDRDILPLYNAMSKSADELKLRICGNSDIDLNEKSNIEIKSRQSLGEIRKYEKETDVLVCICNRYGTQIPGKLYHYAATNKPILIILDGENKEELRKYFETFNRYIMCENTEESITEAIKEIINNKKKYEPAEKLDAKNIAQNLLNILK